MKPLLHALLGLWSLAAAPSRAAEAARPNLLFIFSDDHAQHAISAYGSKVNHTPHIDRLAREGVRFLNRDYLDRTHQFYERHGAKTIVIARFVPIIRTFAPFVAGIARMTYARFALYNVAGGIGWIVSLTLAGYLFGNIPLVRKNFSLVIFAIIIISILPALVEVLRQRRRA